MKQDIIQYLQQQIRTTDERLDNYTHSIDGQEYPKRHMFVKVQKYINDFLNKKLKNHMVIIPGFRGVGKTTLMAQECDVFKNRVKNRLFISVEEANNLFNIGITELISAYEDIIGESLEEVKNPVLIFLDEIQSDSKWAVTLKILFDKTPNVFFCCTGSSAVELQTTPNLARRAEFEKMPPLCFTEFEMIRNKIYPVGELKNKIEHSLYFSKNAKEVFQKFQRLSSQVNNYWSKIDRRDIKRYLSYGTLPFAFTMPNEAAVYNSISLLLDKIINQDLPKLGSFNAETIGAVKRILFAIADNDTTSFNVLANAFGINRLTITNIFDALEKAELLIKLPPYGSNMTVAKKSAKYLFMSPAIRMSFFYIAGQENTFITRQGKLLEDSVGAHLYREFIIKGNGAIRYDSAQGGADFILQIMNERQIIIEAGMGKKDYKQIVKSNERIKSDYNIIFSDSELEIKEDINTVLVPLDYYFLM